MKRPVLQEITNIASAATPAPWTLSEDKSRVKVPRSDGDSADLVGVDVYECDYMQEADAVFICMARSAIPELLAYISAVEVERDELRARFMEFKAQIEDLVEGA